MTFRSMLGGVCAAAFFPAVANGAIVLQYQTAASDTNPTIAPDAAVTSTDVSGDLLAAGSGLSSATGTTWNWRAWSTSSSFGDSVANDDFWTWGFDVTGNVAVDLTDFDIRLDRSSTGPDDFEIQASINGGAALSLLNYDFNGSATGVNFIGTSLTALPTLIQGDSVVFTLGAFNAQNASSGTFDLEALGSGSDTRAIRINGTITSASAVPEPSPVVFVFVCAGSMAVRGGRRRSQRCER